MHASRVCLLAAVALLAGAPPASAQTLVRGTLLDAASGQPIPSGVVTISANRGRWQRSAQSDSAGRFEFEDVSAGPYRLRARRVGYREAAGELGLSADSLVEVQLRMAAASVVLEPVTVVTRSTREVSPVLRGFYDRMQHGFGRYITREEIEARHAVYVADVLRHIPNLRGTAGRMGSANGGFTHGSTGDRCGVVFFLDGLQLNQPGIAGRYTQRDFAIDDYVNADEVEGIEVYRGESDTPAEFVTRWVQCGTVVIWTRRGSFRRG